MTVVLQKRQLKIESNFSVKPQTIQKHGKMEEQLPNVSEFDDSDNVVTLQEVIQSEQALIADANAVLGASDDKNCTYSQVVIYL